MEEVTIAEEFIPIEANDNKHLAQIGSKTGEFWRVRFYCAQDIIGNRELQRVSVELCDNRYNVIYLLLDKNGNDEKYSKYLERCSNGFFPKGKYSLINCLIRAEQERMYFVKTHGCLIDVFDENGEWVCFHAHLPEYFLKLDKVEISL